MIWASKTKSSFLSSQIKDVNLYGSPKSIWIGHFFSSFFLKMVLSCFPNLQSTWIMIDVDLIALLYDLELGFHFVFSDKPNKCFFFWISLPCLFDLSFPFLMWYNKVLSKCQIWVSGHRIVQYKFVKFCPKI